jgi:hypothetical protein
MAMLAISRQSTFEMALRERTGIDLIVNRQNANNPVGR